MNDIAARRGRVGLPAPLSDLAAVSVLGRPAT